VRSGNLQYDAPSLVTVRRHVGLEQPDVSSWEGVSRWPCSRSKGVFWIDYYVHEHRKRERIGPDTELAEVVLKKQEEAEGRDRGGETAG
jgi:hypothetical protein